MSTLKNILDRKSHDVFTINSDMLAIDALRIMDEKGFGVLIIVENDEVTGLFTEGDYISRVLLKSLDRNTTLVDTVMTKNVMTIKPQQDVNASMQLMIEKDIRYIPVVDDGRLLGVISMGDCVKEVIAEQQELIGHLEHYIQG